MIDIIVFVVCAFLSYWAETEFFLFFGSLYLMVRFLYKWYRPVLSIWPKERAKAGRFTLGLLPVAAFFIILFILITMASFDVVGIWVVFYIILGIVWVYGCAFLFEYFLDFHWFDDVIHHDNKAAIFPAIGGFIGFVLIYAGANIGDGPGWWVVFIAGGLGLIIWLGIAMIINKYSEVSEKITVERDMGCGIRFGAYLLASGLILARASGGDWTSMGATLVEFLAGWPVIPLAALALFVEKSQARIVQDGESSHMTVSIFWGSVYIIFAVIVLLMLPGFNENYIYGNAAMVLS